MSVLAEYLAKSESEGRLDGIGGALVDLKVATKADYRCQYRAMPTTRCARFSSSTNEAARKRRRERLVEFRAANPEHPVSVELEERGL